jgi:hypothetical protein
LVEVVETNCDTARPADGADAGGDRPAAVSRAEPTARWRVLAVDACALVGLAGVAITQPLLELLGDNPTFFVAGGYRTSQIIALALIVAFAPPLLLFVVTALPGTVFRRLDRAAHGLGIGILTGLFAIMVCRTLRVDGLVHVAAAALGIGLLVALAEWRFPLVRRFLAYVAVGNVAFVVLFLLASPTTPLILDSGGGVQAADAVVPPLDGPVLVVVFDEFPITAIMRGDGTVNDRRYPHLAELAQRSTWFRNAASESRSTPVSVPTLLSGRRGGPHDLPTLQDHPRNYFSLFGDRYPTNRYELVTDMCPAGVCEPVPAKPTRQLLDDVSLVYRHRALPPELRDGLPPVDIAWGDFGGEGLTPPASAGSGPKQRPDPFGKAREIARDESGSAAQAAVFRQQIGLIDAQPSVNFVHVLLPHHPYRLTPWGDGPVPVTRLPDDKGRGDERLPAADDPAHDFRFRQLHALQAMQIAAVDSLVGEMIDHLESTGAWNDALVVLTSDHGIDTTSPGFTRYENERNTDELFRIPLFIKAPGQTAGAVDDAPASTMDVLPSIIDLLEIDTDWDLEGHSLFDGSEPSIDRHVRTGVGAAIRVAAAHEAQFPRGEDWSALAAVGEGEDLVGDDVSELRMGEPSPLRWSLDHGDDLDDLSIAVDSVPYIMEGTVEGGSSRPPELVVAVNGTLAGTIGGYLPDGDAWQFTGYIAPFFRDGRNEVVAYEVERAAGTVTLHPLGEG